MNQKNYEEERSRRARNVEIYRLHKVEGMSYAALMEKFGLSSAGLWKIYEEMVAYGEEVYGIKLKKAGTK